MKLLKNELQAVGYGLSEDEKVILGGFDETYNSALSTLIKRMISRHTTIDDAKALLLTHESCLERRNTLAISSLLFANISIKNPSQNVNKKR